jgi:glycosyltransferase involved in cell wall biosynthesis
MNDDSILVVTNPSLYGTGGDRRAFEVIKNFHYFNITPILYVPYSELLNSVMIDEITNRRTVRFILRELENNKVIVPNSLYQYMEFFQQELIPSLVSDAIIEGRSMLGGVITQTINSMKFFSILKSDAVKIRNNLTTCLQDLPLQINVKTIYVMHETPVRVFNGAFLAKSLEKPLCILLQLEPFKKSIKYHLFDDWFRRVHFYGENVLKGAIRLSVLLLQSFFANAKVCYRYAFRSNLKGLFSVSSAPLELSGLNLWAEKNGIMTKVIKPANSVDEEISIYKHEDLKKKLMNRKESIAIYYCRLTPEKGLYEIPFIAKRLEDEGYNLLVAGRFSRMTDKFRFFKMCEEKSVKNLSYLGWLPREKLIDVLSRSSVLIYPSHEDAFPLVVLESLFLGCSVVAYDIPAIRSVYGGLKPVKIVKEYDCKAMAEKAISILRNSKEHEEEHFDETFLNFLEQHSSWKNVARAELEAINETLTK